MIDMALKILRQSHFGYRSVAISPLSAHCYYSQKHTLSDSRRNLTSVSLTTNGGTPANSDRSQRELAKLPLTSLLRGLLMHTLMSRPYVMDVASSLGRKNLNLVTKNPLLRILVNRIFYPQFCAGNTESQVRRSIANLKSLGYKGVIVTYAREVDMSESTAVSSKSQARRLHEKYVRQWLEGTLQSIRYSEPGSFVALKYTGAGPESVRLLEDAAEPDNVLTKALDSICTAAKKHGVGLQIDAEHYSQQRGIDAWTLNLMQKFNRGGKIVVYNTYQMLVVILIMHMLV